MITVGEDWSHVPRMRQILKNVRYACDLRGIPNPFREILTPEMIDALEGNDLQDALVTAALPGKLIAVGGPEGKVLHQEVYDKRKKETMIRVVFHDRRHCVMFCMEALERTYHNIMAGSVKS